MEQSSSSNDLSLLLTSRNDDELATLVQEALAYAPTSGLLMRTATAPAPAAPASSSPFRGSSKSKKAPAPPAPTTNPSNPTYAHAPLSLLPNAFPAKEYLKARKLAPLYNTLVERVANDGAWMLQVLESVLPHDDFTRRLVEIYQAIDGKGRDVQKVHLGINRSDYMLHQAGGVDTSPSSPTSSSSWNKSKILQVEINTIASSFGCLSTQVSRLHRYLAQKVLGFSLPMAPSWLLPYNDTMAGLAEGLALAHREYLRQEKVLERTHTRYQQQHPYRRPCVLMVVQPGERNVMDQKFLEIALWESYGIPLLRATLLEVARDGHWDLQRRQNLLLKSPLISEAEEDAGKEEEVEITVAYFRAGYAPTDYPGEEEWKGRELIEMSAAIKCPCISYHLAGTKKVQEALSRPGELERFLPNPHEAALVRGSFAGLYGLEAGNVEGEKAIKDALTRPHAYVLKPQREGGGNNLYDDALVHALSSMSVEERSAFILMEKIQPPPFEAHFVREGQVLHGPAVYELGIYGVFLGDSQTGKVWMNESVGHLLRTKLASSNEGGVAAGFAVLSSPLLLLPSATEEGTTAGGGEMEKGKRPVRQQDLIEYTMSRKAWKGHVRRTKCCRSLLVALFGGGSAAAVIVGMAALCFGRKDGGGGGR